MESLEERKAAVVEEFSMFDEWLDKYEYLIELGKNLEMFHEEQKTEDKLIKGCQSRVWLDWKLEGGRLFFNADSAGCVANFVRAQGLSYKSTIPVSFVNGRLNLNVEKDSFVTVDFGEPIFEPEKIPFKAKQSEKTYIIRAADFNILCGVVSVSGPFCVVEEKDFSSERVNVIGKALSTHERFYDQAGVVFFKANSMDDIELHVYRNNTENKSANLFGACAACAVGINQGKLGNMVTVHIAGEHLKISWNGKGSSATFLACAVHVFDGDMEI